MEKFRTKILACFLAVALVVFTTPISLNFDTRSNSIEIQSNKAHAVVPVAGAAAAFLAEIAAASGLTVGEFVATVVGMAAVGTGIGLATDAGINYGNAASVNLGNLIDAADYPSWDTLTTEQQEDWGTKENYDSAKFNSLLDAFDLGDARNRFYSSAGGNIDYTESETSRLEQLGRIGQNWINNGSNTVQNILDSMNPQYSDYINNYIGNSSSIVIDGSTINGWPNSFPSLLNVNIGNYCLIKSNDSSYRKYTYLQTQSTNDVYFIVAYTGAYKRVTMFSLSNFNWNYNTKKVDYDQEPNLSPVSMTNTATQYEYDGNVYYKSQFSLSDNATYIESNMATNEIPLNQMSNIDSVIPKILFADDSIDELGPSVPDIVGYPEDIEQEENQDVYYPEDGVTPNMTWINFTTPPESNPGTGGEVDLTEIIQLLQRFHFTVDYNLLVQDNPLRSAVMELVSGMNKFKFYNSTDELKVHDAGVYDGVGHIYSLMEAMSDQLDTIIGILSSFFITDTTTDVIGDLNFPDLGDKALDLVDTISTLAPFGAMFLISELVAIMSQVTKIQTPSMVFDFNFMAGHEYNLTIDLSWLDDVKPLINLACIFTLIVGLAGTTARLIELEAAA